MLVVKNSFLNLKLRGTIACGVLLISVTLFSGIILVRARIARPGIAKSGSFDAAASTAATLPGARPATPLEAEHITLRRTGFEPAEINRPVGRFLLAIDNMSAIGGISFRLLNQNGARLQEFPSNRRYRLRQVIDLPPGQYSLAVINHPEWVCRITLTARE